MQAINTDKSSGLDHCHNTCSHNMQFLHTDPVSPEISRTQSYKKRKHGSFPNWFYFDSIFYLVSISTFLIFSCFVSTSTYLISWHYHTTGGSNRAVTSATLFLKFEDNGDHASCQSTTADAAQRVDEERTTAGKTFICQFLSWTGLRQEQRKDNHSKRHQRGAILKHIQHLNWPSSRWTVSLVFVNE